MKIYKAHVKISSSLLNFSLSPVNQKNVHCDKKNICPQNSHFRVFALLQNYENVYQINPMYVCI